VNASRHLNSRLIAKPLLVVAALCALLMPVQYRGGADVAHPHAVFQFWRGGHADPFDHHGHDHRIAGSFHEQSFARTNAPPDTPVLTGLASVDGQALGMAILAVAGLMVLGLHARHRHEAPPMVILRGRVVSPEPPPPRLIFASVCREG
jgi:hypothetical protein